MLNFAGRWSIIGLFLNAPVLSAASLGVGVSAEVIEVQSGITFASLEPDKGRRAGTEVALALFSGCGEGWGSLTLGERAGAEFELWSSDMRFVSFEGVCGRSLKLNNRGRIVNVESKRVVIRGQPTMSVKVHF